MAKPSYPQEILPCHGWKQTMMVSDILKSCPKAVLGHLLVGNKEQCVDDSLGLGMETIRRDVLPLDRMANLSCSLLSTYFMLVFFHFLPDNEGKQTWKPDNVVTDDLLKEDNYNFYPEITVVGWYLGSLEHHPIPYPRSFAKVKEFHDFQEVATAVARNRKKEIVQKEWQDLAEDETNKKLRIADFTGEVRCNHDPTFLNYWHFTIDLYSADDNENPLKNTSKGWREKMGIWLQDYLCNSFMLLTEDEQVSKVTDKSVWEK